MSAPGVALFLDGTSPRSSTLEKIRRWHLKDAAARGPCPETVRNALALLVSHLPPGTRKRVSGLILAELARSHRAGGEPGPPLLAPSCEGSGLQETL